MPDQSTNDPPEEWRPIVGYEGIYEVSSLGRVKRVGEAPYSPMSVVGMIMRTRISHRGYPVVTLSRDAKIRLFRVHTLVARAFVGAPPTPKHEVNHKDTVKTNNRVDNLEWVTRGENIRHAARHGLMRGKPPIRRGEANNKTRLTDALVRSMRQDRKTMRIVDLAAKYGVRNSTVSRICLRQVWKHVD